MKKAILTGHSRGLGAALAADLQGRGFEVLGIARHPAADIQAQQIALDLADTAALRAWLDTGALAAFVANATQVLLINNAGTVQPIGPAGTPAAEAVERALALNLTAPLLLTGAFIAATAHCADRRVLHVSSGAGRHAYPGWSLYCAGKAALDRHAQALALEKHPGLRIASLAPGVVNTDMQAEIRACSAEQFPLRERFVELQTRGQLASAAATAATTVDYLLTADFGAQVLVDLRDLAPR